MLRYTSVLAALGATALIVSSAGSAHSGQVPTLRVLTSNPLVVRGVYFRSLEPVTVTAHGTVSKSRRVIARSTGSFTVDFDSVPVSRCSGFSITAVGARGSKATFKLPRPACIPARSGGSSG